MEKLVTALSENQKKLFGEGLLKLIDDFGLGTLSKADLEARIYSLLRQNIDSDKVKDSRDWIRYLRVTPSKLRNMQLLDSVKQRPIELSDKNQWKDLANSLNISRIEISDKANGLIRFYLDDAHLKRFVEEFVIEKGSSIDYKENRGQIVLKYSMYIELMMTLGQMLNIEEKDIVKNIANDSDFKKIENEFNNPRQLWKDIKTKFQDKAIDELAGEIIKLSSTALIKVVKAKILGDK